MPRQEQGSQPGTTRRRALFFGGAGLVSAAAGIGGGLAAERGQRPPLPKSDIGILYKTGTLSAKEGHMLRNYIDTLRKDADSIAEHITTPDIKTEPKQGLQTAPYQPEVRARAIAQAILLMADVQLGTEGRNGVAEALKERGLAVHFENTQPDVKKGEKPFVLPIPDVTEKANLRFLGQARQETVDDFGILDSIYNGLVLPIGLGHRQIPGVPADSLAAQLPNAGYELAAIASTVGAAHLMPFHERDRVSRRAFTGRLTGAALVAGAAAVLIVETNVGGRTIDAINSTQIVKPTLGTDYTHPANQFKPLFASAYFKGNIKGKLITQRSVPK